MAIRMIPPGACHDQTDRRGACRTLPASRDGGSPCSTIASGFRSWRQTNYLISNSLGAVPVAVAASLQSYYEAWATRGVRAWEDSGGPWSPTWATWSPP